MRLFETGTFIPIFHTFLTLNVSTDIPPERRSHPEFGLFIGPMTSNEIGGLASCEKGEFGIFLNIAKLNHGVVAHEIFHITHQVMKYIGEKFDVNHQEQHAYLCEWITNWVYVQLEKNNINLWQ